MSNFRCCQMGPEPYDHLSDVETWERMGQKKKERERQLDRERKRNSHNMKATKTGG